MENILQVMQIIVGSGLILAVYNNYSQIKLQNKLKLTEITENKFRSILIFMYIMLNPEKIVLTSEIGSPLLKSIDINNNNEVVALYKEVIEANKANLYLYADEKLIDSVNNFLTSPSEENYVTVAKMMNRRLWK